MKVIAKQRGFYGVVRTPGEVFEFDLEKDGKYPYKRDSDGEIVRDDFGTAQRDMDGKPELPSWVAEANDENKQEYSDLPLMHPALDEENRPFLYTSPGVPASQAADVAPNVENVSERGRAEKRDFGKAESEGGATEHTTVDVGRGEQDVAAADRDAPDQKSERVDKHSRGKRKDKDLA